MENLFHFAKKELSQDAFLRWLFENYNCEDQTVRNASIKLLSELCGTDFNNEIINNLHTYSQTLHRIDISVIIETDKRKIGLFIEDKVSSSEHNQLVKYNFGIDKIRNEKNLNTVYKVYYKTDDLYEWERIAENRKIGYKENKECEAVKNAGWKIKNIYKINELFTEYKNCQNNILSDYANHISNVTDELKNTKKPNDDSFLKWKSYFHRTIAEKIKDKCDPFVKKDQYPYTYLQVFPKGEGENGGMPYLEIQSDDCLNNQFIGRILLYGAQIDTDIVKKMQCQLRETGDNLFIFTGTRKKDPKQLGKTKQLPANDTNTFLTHLNKCIDNYLQMMEIWRHR